MSKLRWTLLILGGAFILALGLWERWRPRHARGPAAKPRGSARHVPAGGLSGDDPPTPMDTDPSVTLPADPEEPWIGETGFSDVLLTPDKGEGGPSGPERSWMARGAGREEASSGIGRATAERSAAGDPHRETREGAGSHERAAAQDRSGSDAEAEAFPGAAPGCGRAGVAQQQEDRRPPIRSRAAASGARPGLSEEPVLAPAALDAELRSAADESLFTEELDEYPTAELPVLAEAAEYAPASPALEQTASLEAPGQAAPIVEWPPEASRQIVALRLVAPPERFPGRAVRLALAAEGFLLGQFDIFHKPDETHRAVVSVASLTRPGTFDLDTMDSQRYAGLSLFVVLPGPCPGQQAFDELVGVALNLRERLQGELQDARGEMLTDESIELLRDALFPGSAGEAES